MQTNDKQYYIYIRSTRERIPCTKEEFDAYYHDINLFRQKQQRHGKCVCPEKKRLDCDMDCASCPFRRAGDTVSLDYKTTHNEDGEEIAWIDSLEDPSPLIADIVADRETLLRIFDRLNDLMPEALDIGKMRLAGKSDLAISAEIGIKNTTFRSRLERVKKVLASEFPEFF
jgi:hypothetical protein